MFSPADDTLMNLWSGCEENFLCSVSKQSQLNTALEKPHQDLGPQIVDRLKGFSSHLLVRIRVHFKKIIS